MTQENYIGPPMDLSKVSELRVREASVSSYSDPLDNLLSQQVPLTASYKRTDSDQEWSSFMNLVK